MKPNFLLVTIDALRSDAVGSFGARDSRTSVLDDLAVEGVRFERAITNGDHTKVAFPAALTSTYGSMFSGCNGPLSVDRPTLPSVLNRAGYHTAAVVTSPLLGREYGYDRGFDIFRQLEPADFGAHWYQMKGAQRLLRQPLTHQLLSGLQIDTRMPPLYADAGQTTDAASELLSEISTPFFLWLHYMDAHWPYHPAADMRESHELACGWRDLQITYRANELGEVPPPAVIERLRSLYQRSISRVDREIGRLLTDLKRRSLWEQTVIVATSDHGEAFFEHGTFGHRSLHLYQEILRIPLIIRGPEVVKGQVQNVPVQLLDLPPTLLEMSGQSIPNGMLGQSLIPLLRGESFISRPYLLSEAVGTRLIWVAVLRDQYKLIWAPAEPLNYEVYDLVEDPGEEINLRGRLTEVEEEFLAVARQHQAFVEDSRRKDAQTPDLDETVLDRLRALGYVE